MAKNQGPSGTTNSRSLVVLLTHASQADNVERTHTRFIYCLLLDMLFHLTVRRKSHPPPNRAAVAATVPPDGNLDVDAPPGKAGRAPLAHAVEPRDERAHEGRGHEPLEAPSPPAVNVGHPRGGPFDRPGLTEKKNQVNQHRSCTSVFDWSVLKVQQKKKR